MSSLVAYSTLLPTQDPVKYDPTKVDYPAYNVVDTFGTIWASKISGNELTALEVGSSGKLAFSPCNLHSLDLLLDDPASSNVRLQARNRNSLVIGNDLSSAEITVADSGAIEIASHGGSNMFRSDVTGNYLSAVSGSNTFSTSSGGDHSFWVAGKEIALVEESGVSVSNLVVNGTDFRVPIGLQTVRPVGTDGQIFYYKTTTRFEGFSAGSWTGLGGVIDVDQNTYITAEDFPGANNNELKFVTNGTERMRIDSVGKLGYGTSNPQWDFDVKGEVSLETVAGNSLVVSDTGGLTVYSYLGGTAFGVHQLGAHTFSVGGAEIARVEDSGVSVSNLVINGTDFRVPIGLQPVRPVGTDGQIFYNKTTTRFEGFSAGSWSGLGGVIDVDQNTYIIAEDAPGSNNNELKFVTDGVERMRIDSTGKMGYGTSNPQYAIDVVGDLRVSGMIIGKTSAIDMGGKSLNLAVKEDGSNDIVDGLDTNHMSGLNVEGVPKSTLFRSEHRHRFEKSLKWYFGENGMTSLGKKDKWDEESYWKLRGGAFHLSHTNADTGAEVAFIMRVNEKDELQLVRHVSPTNGQPETYDVVAKFGNQINAKSRHAAETGFAEIDYDNTFLDPANLSTISAQIKSFSAYSDYKVHGALYPVSATPTAAAVVADSANGFVSGTLSGGVDNGSAFVFTSMHNGSPLASIVYKFCAVIENTEDGTFSPVPRTSFVVYDYKKTINAAVASIASLSALTYTITFQGLQWSLLSQADQNIFSDYLEKAIVKACVANGIKLKSLNLSFADGSVKCTVTCLFDAANTTAALTTVYNPAEPLAMIGGGSTVPLVDSAPYTVTAAATTTVVDEILRLASVPQIVSLAETDSTGDSVTLSWEVADELRDVTKLHVLVSFQALASPVLASSIINATSGYSFYNITTATGSFTRDVDVSKRTFIYVVAENSDGVYSEVERVVSEPFSVILPSSIAMSEQPGEYLVASQSSTGVAMKSGMTILSSTPTATAHLLIYEQGDAEIPATAAEAFQAITGGSSSATAGMP